MKKIDNDQENKYTDIKKKLILLDNPKLTDLI